MNTKTIEELLEEQLRKAELCAADPHRFLLLSLEGEVAEDDGTKQLVMYNGGDWDCTCAFFEDWKTCSHVMAVRKRFGEGT